MEKGRLHGKRASTGRLEIEATMNSNEDVDKLQLKPTVA